MWSTPSDGMNSELQLVRRIRFVLTGFIVALVVSGLTAFPLEWELNLLARMLGATDSTIPGQCTGLLHWIVKVRDGLRATYVAYPFIGYGTDWLAFAHVVIALFFIGPWREPVRNVWVVEAGMVACVLVVPLALVCGPVRGIPVYWRLIDCLFGVLGFIPLWLVWRWTKMLNNVSRHGVESRIGGES